MLLHTPWRSGSAAILLLTVALPMLRADDATNQPGPATPKVSYYERIRPLFQAYCHGCHQPARAKGGYVMTTLEQLLAGGESGHKAVVPNKPEESYLLEMITPQDDKAKMPPQGQKPLHPYETGLIRRWIRQGAVDDTPASAKIRFDPDHPPVYTRPPVITSLDFSPDGQYLAVAGFNEVLLLNADGSQLVARLVGLSERIQSVRFSPDGKYLAAIGGQPARLGEVQVWDVAKQKLKLSVPVTYDTLYGVSWSPDGSQIAFGCTDKTVRAVSFPSGEQVLQQGSHDDWALDTVFSTDGSHLVSVGRDMTVKLTEVATQRFVDNVTSITPGALKGGILAVTRHPKLDHIVVGGSDGTPKVYRIFRESKRIIGDDANLIFELFPLAGRVFSVRFSPDGKRIAAGSSLNGAGEVVVCSYDYNGDVPADVKAIMAKVPGTRNAQEKAALEGYRNRGVRLLARVPVPQSGVYAVAFRPDGQIVAAAGADGTVRLFDAATGKLIREFAPAPLSTLLTTLTKRTRAIITAPPRPEEPAEPEKLPPGAKVVGLDVQPATIQLTNPFAYAQLLVTARLDTGETQDVTRLAELKVGQDSDPANLPGRQDRNPAPRSGNVVAVSRTGVVRPKVNGPTTLQVQFQGQSAAVPVEVKGMTADYRADYVRDVMPVLSRLGCNGGTCHGSAKGKNGFKLSLRGYDPLFDVRALTDDLAARRANIASPDDSLMLLKATANAPHEAGQLIRPGEPYYEILRNWIAHGATLDLKTPRVGRIELFPANPVAQKIGARQQMRVLATYADGLVRDVTQDAYLDSGNTDVAYAERGGVMTAIRRGEAPILARFEGAYAATTLTVMGDRSGFVWQEPPANNRIDELVAAKWQRLKIQPSELCTDVEFLRRVSLDLTGLPPTADEVRAFMADRRDTHVKRDELIDRLVGSDAYVEYWTNKWADLLQVNRKFLGAEGAAAFRQWIRGEVAGNTPYDQFARKVLTASGSNKENPPASYYKILREPTAIMENTTQLFLAVRFNCNKCHDHPFERWTQDQYYQLAAYFARVDLKPDAKAGGAEIGKTAVEKGKPLYEIVTDKKEGEVLHDRTGQVTPPQFPFTCRYDAPAEGGRRQQLAAWVTSSNNPYFARTYVNRLWGYLFGVGIIEPIDDVRAGNPSTNPELLAYLTEEFVSHGFDVRHVLRLICKSRTYQLSVATNVWNRDDKINYAHALARRLPAEVLLDTVYRVTGETSRFPGLPPGTRAAALPDSGVELSSGFLGTLGRPPRESACECERTTGLQMGPVMALINGPTIADAIDDPQNELTRLVAREKDDAKLVAELFLRILNRPATAEEVETSLKVLHRIEGDHEELLKAVKRREEEVAPIRAQQQKEREAAIARAKEELAAYEKGAAPQEAAREQQRQATIAQLTKELKQYETRLPAQQAEWEKKQPDAVKWVPLEPTTLTASNGAKLTRKADQSVLASGKNGKGVYTIVAPTELRGITAIRLEALADDSLPRRGPGRAPDGNFVLSQLELKAAPRGDAKNAKKVELQRPLADFSQESFAIKSILNPAGAPRQGWAISPYGGVTHWATFAVKEPVGHEGGTILTFTLDHQFKTPNFMLGRFRISITTARRPTGLSLSEELGSILAVPPEQRDDKQRAALLRHFRSLDSRLQQVSKDLAEAKKPLPIDPKLKELRDNLEYVNRPAPDDRKLTQLRQDVEMSTKLLTNRRLTGAQDITWALINSPAFLFNR